MKYRESFTILADLGKKTYIEHARNVTKKLNSTEVKREKKGIYKYTRIYDRL